VSKDIYAASFRRKMQAINWLVIDDLITQGPGRHTAAYSNDVYIEKHIDESLRSG
jgi:hypothetical protein